MTELVSFVFRKLVSMSLAASVFILLTCAVRLLAKKLPKRLPCILWAACTVRLLVPFSLRGSFSLLPRSVSSLAESVSGGAEIVPGAIESVPGGAESAIAESSAIPVVSFGETLLRILPYVWLAGVFAFAVYAVLSALRMRRILRGRIPFDAAGLSCLSADLQNSAVDLPARARVFTVPDLPSAFCRGVFRPAVYLPEELSPYAAHCVLAHEAAHLRRLDPLRKGAAFLALALHWMNPLVWIAFRLLDADMEMAADESVLARDGSFRKTDYSQILLNCASGRTSLPLSVLAFRRGTVGRRIRNVLSFKKLPRPLVTVLTTLVVLFGTTMLWDPPAPVPPDLAENPAAPPLSLQIPEQESLPADSVQPVPKPAQYGEVPFEDLLPEYQAYYAAQEAFRLLKLGEANAMPPESSVQESGGDTPGSTVSSAPDTPLPQSTAPPVTPSNDSASAPSDNTHTVFVIDLRSLSSAASAADPE